MRFFQIWMIGSLLTTSVFAQDLPIDKNATKETVSVYRNLKKLSNGGRFLFGHQDDFAYGVGWKDVPGKSDIKDITGDYPALCGWDLAGIETGNSLDIVGVSFDAMKEFVQQGYERGGVITFSWHLNNPLTRKSAWDRHPGTVASILPAGEKNELYKSWLDKVAAYMLSLKGKHGEYIPVILRLFHELNGSWFWWGGNNCTPDEIKQLWHFTVSYLRDKKNVHNLLYAFNTDRFANETAYLERYPGDEWVDITGFDIYQKDFISINKYFLKEFDRTLTNLDSIARKRNKIPALTEFGYVNLPDSTWWTQVFLKAMQTHKMAYALAWRNGGNTEYYVPYPGQRSAGDFKLFYKTGNALFEKQARHKRMYR